MDPRVMAGLASMFIERNGAVSPDGRWIAYESNPSGQFEVYVPPFPRTETWGLESVGEWR